MIDFTYLVYKSKTSTSHIHFKELEIIYLLIRNNYLLTPIFTSVFLVKLPQEGLGSSTSIQWEVASVWIWYKRKNVIILFSYQKELRDMAICSYTPKVCVRDGILIWISWVSCSVISGVSVKTNLNFCHISEGRGPHTGFLQLPYMTAMPLRVALSDSRLLLSLLAR